MLLGQRADVGLLCHEAVLGRAREEQDLAPIKGVEVDRGADECKAPEAGVELKSPK